MQSSLHQMCLLSTIAYVYDSSDSNGAFTLPDSDSDKVSDSDNITVHSYGTHIKIGNKIGIGSVSVNRP